MYVFTPPTVDYRIGSDSLWGRMTHQRGLAVVVYGSGAIATKHEAPSIDGAEVTAVYSSGRRHQITEAEATALTDAGYGAYVEEVA